MTPGALGRRYAPLIVLAAVQLLLVAVAPSGPASTTGPYANGYGNGSSASFAGAAGSAGSAGGASSASFQGSGSALGASAADTGAGGAGAGGSSLSGSAAGSTAGGAAGGGTGGAAPGSLFNCGPNGKTVGPTFYMPPCTRVVAAAQNGGATMPGVTGDSIKFVYYAVNANPQVNAVLGAENLAASPQQLCQAAEAFTNELNKRFNLYGRHFVSINGPGSNSGPAYVKSQGGSCSFPFFQSQCPQTPPNPPCDRAEADLIASLHPAFVLAAAAPSSAFYNELGKDQIVVAGGETEPDSYHQQVAPFYWDVFESGTLTAQMDAQYWCNKLNGKRVQYAGNAPGDVMTFGGIGKPPPVRRLAVLYPATNGDPTYKDSVDVLLGLINGKECPALGGQAQGFPYQSDITTAQTQSTTTVAALKNGHFTDVMAFGDPVAPVFFSNTADTQGYHPEILLSGMGLIDYDVLGQLYNKNVWRFAFGPSSLQDNVPFSQSDAAKAYTDGGGQGSPDQTENLYWAYFNWMGSAAQLAGPNLNPGTIRSGLFAAPGEGGDRLHPLIQYGQASAYTGIQDMREVFWCGTTPSQINNQPGAYVSVEDPVWRHRLGQWPGDLKVFPNGPCAP